MNDRLALALLTATGLHGLLIFGVSFDIHPTEDRRSESTLEITIVKHHRESKAPEKADFLSQVDQEGGGSEETPIKPTTAPSPAPVRPAQTAIPEIQHDAAREPEPSTQKLVTVTKAPRKTVSATPSPPRTRHSKLTAAELLAQRSREIQRITAELERKTRAYAKRPRRKFINASTKEYKYAFYQEAWRKKVKRIGELNYPEEATRRRLYGKVVVHTAIRADGTLEGVDVVRSSGIKVLDDAAIRAVRLAAPFAPFPEDIASETDILDITRTFSYQKRGLIATD
jgi:protein TonB